MKFILAKEYLYWWPIKIELPDPTNPGKWKTMSYTHQFAGVDEDAAIALGKEIEALPTQEERKTREHDLLIQATRGWRDVVDEDGNEVEYSEEVFRQALQQTWYRVALYSAYANSLASPAARKGN
ncbi:hypothetical protein NKJ73_23760 [Mesorhizobium sp. M0074]|uniref:hypothetical protein n=1 Tax=Mesorhizobium sp. M0074 TaxID=2956869 RepID=UPI0033383026